MELKDMGYKDSISTAVPSESKQPKIRYPSFSLDKNIPEEVMNKDIGDICRIELIVKIIGKSINQYSEDRNERLELEIHKLGYVSKAGGKTKEEYLAMTEEERAKHDKAQLDMGEDGKDEGKDENAEGEEDNA